MEQQQQTAIKPKVLTKTNTAVMLSVGMIAAFFVGLNMLFFMGNVVETIATPYKKVEPVIIIDTAEAKMVKDIDYATVQVDPATNHDTDDLQFLNIYANGYPNTNDSVDLGTFNFTGEVGYEDMNIADEKMPLAIQISPGSHPAMLLTIHIPAYVGSTYQLPSSNDTPNVNEEEGWDILSSLFKVKEANALQIYEAETFSICIPEREYIETLGRKESSNSKFGIKVADAIVVDPNLGYSYLYVDEDGNTYYDIELTQQANTEDCNSFTNRALNINDITSGTMTPESPAEILNYTLAKGWESYLVLAGYNAQEGFVDINNDELGVQSPLYIIGDSGNSTNGSLPINQFELTLETNEGTKEICVPEIEENTSLFYYFYDNDGAPYNDMLLTDEVDCNIVEPYLPDYITDASVSTGSIESWVTMHIAQGQYTMGWYEDGLFEFQPIEEQTGDEFGFNLQVFSTVGEDYVLPEAKITVTDENGDKELCFPTTQITPQNNGPQDNAVIIYYDINGNPYSDAALTSQIYCGNSVEQYLPDYITDASVSTGSIESWVTMHIAQGQYTMGWYEDGLFEFQPIEEQTGDEFGFNLQVFSTVGEDYVLPEAKITVTDENGDKELCFPTTQITPQNNGPQDNAVIIYYDINGNPYSDAALTSQIYCGNSVDPIGCSWVTDGYCNKYPTHECCTVISNEDVAL